jgi:hypothetical protein
MKPKVLIGKGYKRRKLTKKKFANHEMLSGKGYRNKRMKTNKIKKKNLITNYMRYLKIY